MINLTGSRGVSRRSFISTITGAAALTLFNLDRSSIASAEPADGLLTDYVGRICYNENPLGPSPAAIDAIIGEAKMSHRYPDWYADSLVSDLADHFDVSTSRVMCGSGATEMLRLAAMAFAESGGNIVAPYPSYSQFPSDAQFFGSSVRYGDLDANYRVDLDALYNEVDGDTTCVSITNPNNPTGTYIPFDLLEEFVDSLPSHVVTLIDEAYFELLTSGELYHDHMDDREIGSAVELVRQDKNVVVIRTFSKAYGLAGARIGYAIGNSSAINSMKSNRIYATVSRASLEAAKAALGDRQHILNTTNHNNTVKSYCFSKLDEMELDYIPSVTSFFMVDVGDGAAVRSELGSKGIYVRNGWGMPAHIRVSIGTESEMTDFIGELREIMENRRFGKQINPYIPESTELFQAYPNPFNSSTSIRIFIPSTQKAKLEIFDIRGRLVNTLANSIYSAGDYTFRWNGVNNAGKSVSSGSYFYRLSVGEDVLTKRMILIK